MGGQGWGSLVPPTIQCTLGKGWAFLLMEEGGAFASCKGRRISLAWCVLLQKGGFSSKGKGNETEKCFLLSRRDGEPCVISAVCRGCSLRIRGQRPQGAGGLRDTGPAPALRLRVGTATSSPMDGRQCLGTGQLGVLHTDPRGSLDGSYGGTGRSQPKAGTEMGLRRCWRGFGQRP